MQVLRPARTLAALHCGVIREGTEEAWAHSGGLAAETGRPRFKDSQQNRQIMYLPRIFFGRTSRSRGFCEYCTCWMNVFGMAVFSCRIHPQLSPFEERAAFRWEPNETSRGQKFGLYRRMSLKVSLKSVLKGKCFSSHVKTLRLDWVWTSSFSFIPPVSAKC